MKISIDRENLLSALQAVANVVERRQSLPVLSNILLTAEGAELALTATDMEVESVARVEATIARPGTLTVPGRKLLDICRSLPPQSALVLEEKDGKLKLQSGRSRFTLSTLPASDFPTLASVDESFSVALEPGVLQGLISSTQFAMAHQDVRYYLNGLLLEVGAKSLKAVATDGHRLAMAEAPIPGGAGEEVRQLIIPRKGVAEMLRLASQSGEAVTLSGSANQIRVLAGKQALTVKLVDGKFPDYERVIPRNGDKLILSNREQTKAALQRTSILSNEKFRGVRLNFSKGALKASTHNPEQEEAEEDIEIEYQGEPLEIGFNVSYLLDVLNVLGSEKVQISLSDPNSSCLIQAAGEERAKYVVMPMRL